LQTGDKVIKGLIEGHFAIIDKPQSGRSANQKNIARVDSAAIACPYFSGYLHRTVSILARLAVAPGIFLYFLWFPTNGGRAIKQRSAMPAA
jgi:hypothetical protein